MIIGIGGEPATGKSTLMRAVLGRLPAGRPFKSGLVSGTLHDLNLDHRVAVLGRYDAADAFPGTDRLSMAVSPAFIEWLDEPGRPNVVLFEGDRLFTGKVLDACACRFEPCRFMILNAAPTPLAARRAHRTQGTTFLRGRATKYTNLAEYPNVAHYDHSDAEATSILADYIQRLAEL